MKLTHVCIITDDLSGLAEFYRRVLQIEPQVYREDYQEFATEGAVLSLFSLASHEQLAPGTMQARANRTLELEFQVADVDQEYGRLKKMDLEWLMAPPVTLSWGNRSIYFRDPDGNLINFYSLVED